MNNHDLLTPPDEVAARAASLGGMLKTTRREISRQEKELAAVREYLGLTDAISDALEKLSQQMFGQIADLLEQHLTQALQEVLEQPLQLKVERDYLRGRATISFHIEREGNKEDILKGQGGSVANVLSVGLRFFALQTLDEEEHRRFLVLDEQDCWLRPDLVPLLVKIVYLAGKSLGFQVLMISHHDVTAFQQFADRIYRLKPTPAGVVAEEVFSDVGTGD